MRALALTLGALALLALAGSGCGDDNGFNPEAARPYQGSAFVYGSGGKVALTVDGQTPIVRLDSQFYLQLAGSGEDSDKHSYRIILLIDPMAPPERFELPGDATRLTASVERAGSDVPLSSITGFIDVTKGDDGGPNGSAIVSLILNAGSVPLVELSLVFGQN